MKAMLLTIGSMIVLAGCRSIVYDTGVKELDHRPAPPPEDLTAANVVGAYEYCDGYWTWEIGLRSDGHFIAAHLQDTGGFEIDADGYWRETAGRTVVFSMLNSDKTVQITRYDLCLVADRLALIENPPRKLGGKLFRRVYTRLDEPVLTANRTPPVDQVPPTQMSADRSQEYRKADFRRHPFEKDLLVYDPSLPLLTKAEWDEIRSQLGRRKDYAFHSACRESLNSVRVEMEGSGNRSP